MNKDQYGPGIAMTDLATNLLGVFICLFMLAFLLMSKKIEEKNNKVESKAEFLITVTWTETSNNDVDTYVEDPNGNLVFFRAREKGLMHLDRDDLGMSNDSIRTADGQTIQVKENREIVTIRGIIPGEYVVNTHMYIKKDQGDKTAVKVRLEKINPALKIITQKEFELGDSGDEKTAFRFIIDKEGDVTNVSDLAKELATPLNPRTPAIPYPQGPYNPNGPGYPPLPEVVPPTPQGATP